MNALDILLSPEGRARVRTQVSLFPIKYIERYEHIYVDNYEFYRHSKTIFHWYVLRKTYIHIYFS